MSKDIIDNLANRTIELDHAINTARLFEISERDTSIVTVNESNRITKKVKNCHIRLLKNWLKSNNESQRHSCI